MDTTEALTILDRGPQADRAAALRWLGRFAPGALQPGHAALLGDPDLEVRVAAATVLRASADPTLVDAARRGLRDLVLSPDLTTRHAGLRAAAELANPTLAPRLLAFLGDPDPETRRLTLLALAAVPDGLLAPDFLRNHAATALEDPDPAVRAAAQNLLTPDNRQPIPDRSQNA